MNFRTLALGLAIFPAAALAAAPFQSISLQGFLKTTGGVPVSGTYNGRVTLSQNAAPCWNSGAVLIPITFTDGAFVKTLSGGVSSGLCSGALGSTQFQLPATFTWTLALDLDADNVTDTSFANIPITPVPLAMVAETISGTIAAAQVSGGFLGDRISGGTFGPVDGSQLTALNASNLGSGTVPVARLGSGTPSVSTFLRGDGSWQVVAGVGETNTASNLGTGAGVFKQKVGVDLELRTLLSGSGRLSVTAGVNEILMDVVEGSLTLANLAGSLSGSRISGGTFGAVNAANLTNINGGSITSGIVSASRLGSGAPGSGNFLRGDGTWQAIPASGEANTASNVGLGAGVFKQKTSADLEFRSLVPGSSKISVSQNTDDVTLDVDESSISLANLTGSLSGSKISGGTFGAVNSSNLTNLHASNLTTGTVATARLGSGLASGSTFLRGDGTWATPPSAGEVNTASNVGSGGEVYKQKVGADLEYRTLSSASSRLTITQNANELTFDVSEANLTLANIGGTLSGSKVSGGTLGAASGANLTSLNAASLATGTVATARLGSGTADASTYLRGDGTWTTPPAGGEANTASNLGSGAQVYKQKVGVDLQLRSVAAASSKVTVTQNANDIGIDVSEANLNTTNFATGTINAAILPAASAAASGIVTTGAQTLAGAKTMNDAFTISNILALSAANVATAATINCLASATAVVRLTGTTATVVNGISPGVNGQILVVYTDGNIGTSLTMAHNNANACTNGRLYTNTAANIVSTTVSSTAAYVFVYNGPSLRWHMVTAAQ